MFAFLTKFQEHKEDEVMLYTSIREAEETFLATEEDATLREHWEDLLNWCCRG